LCHFSEAEVSRAQSYIVSHPDYSSYHLLLSLRSDFSAAYARIPNSTKLAILCDVFKRALTLNDWGDLSGNGYEDKAALALLETGLEALPHITPLLDDRTPVSLSGSEERTISVQAKYRRCDYAYRYVCLILGISPKFDFDPEERDKEIVRLKEQIARRGKQT
jgi:hypothetical protein